MPEEFITIVEENPVDIEQEDTFAVEEVIAFTLFEVGEIIKELVPGSFVNEELAIELANMIDDVFLMLDEGMFYEALDTLKIYILQRTDGCAHKERLWHPTMRVSRTICAYG